MKILLIEDNQEEVRAFQAYFATCDNVELVGVTGSESEGLLLTKRYYPDAIILDIELEEGNGLAFISALDKLDLPVKPYVVVTTWISEKRTGMAMRDKGAGYVQLKSKPGYSERGPQMILGVLRQMEPYFGCGGSEPSPIPLPPPTILEDLKRERISDALGRIKINRGLAAQTYLEEAIYIVSESLSGSVLLIDMENIVYPALEKKFRLGRKSLEKSMRTKIEEVWRRVDPETLCREYTQYVDPSKGKPMLKDFITYYAEKVK